MSELDVRIVRLEPVRVIAAHGFGSGPEYLAWAKIKSFLEESGRIDNLKDYRFFGFNNPDPSPGSPNYGYEQWITVGPDVEAVGDVEVKTFTGGLYAVTVCTVDRIGQAWKQLVNWREDSHYQQAHHQWLEECLNTDYVLNNLGGDPSKMRFDIYLPIAE